MSGWQNEKLRSQKIRTWNMTSPFRDFLVSEPKPFQPPSPKLDWAHEGRLGGVAFMIIFCRMDGIVSWKWRWVICDLRTWMNVGIQYISMWRRLGRWSNIEELQSELRINWLQFPGIGGSIRWCQVSKREYLLDIEFSAMSLSQVTVAGDTCVVLLDSNFT